MRRAFPAESSASWEGNTLMRVLALLLISALSLASSSAFATVFAGTHSLVIVGDGVVGGELVAPPGFFDDIPAGTPVIGSSQYDDTAPQLFAQCFNLNIALGNGLLKRFHNLLGFAVAVI